MELLLLSGILGLSTKKTQDSIEITDEILLNPPSISRNNMTTIQIDKNKSLKMIVEN